MSNNSHNHNNSQLDSELRKWLDPKDSLTFDQWVTCHLAFINLLQPKDSSEVPALKRLDILSYKNLLVSLIQDVLKDAKEPGSISSERLSEKLQFANEALYSIFENARNENTDFSSLVNQAYSIILPQIASTIPSFLKEESFAQHFDDILFENNDVISSEKAKKLTNNCIFLVREELKASLKALTEMESYKMSEEIKQQKQAPGVEEGVEEGEDEEDDDTDLLYDPEYIQDYLNYIFEGIPKKFVMEERLLLMYRCQWEFLPERLEKMTYHQALSSHVIFLDLCKRLLESKLYSKYKKASLKAISAFKDGMNPKQQEFNLRNANQAFVKLREKMLDWIEEEYDDDSEESLNKDKFVLATDMCVMGLGENYTKERSEEFLKDLDIFYDSYSSLKLTYLSSVYYSAADDLFEKIVYRLNAEDEEDDPESLTDEYEDWEDDEDDFYDGRKDYNEDDDWEEEKEETDELDQERTPDDEEDK